MPPGKQTHKVNPAPVTPVAPQILVNRPAPVTPPPEVAKPAPVPPPAVHAGTQAPALKEPPLVALENALLRLTRTIDAVAGPLTKYLTSKMDHPRSAEEMTGMCYEVSALVRDKYPQMTFQE